jgi:hypothetical protein
MKILTFIIQWLNAHKIWQVMLKLDRVGDEHAQRNIGNGVTIPPHDFKQSSRWY